MTTSYKNTDFKRGGYYTQNIIKINYVHSNEHPKTKDSVEKCYNLKNHYLHHAQPDHPTHTS